MSYEEISRLLDKYSIKQPSERWSSEVNIKYDKILKTNDKLRLFDGINSEYFRLVGTQKDRAKYLIKKLNFNKICPKCSSEQMIVLICYFVKCEYNPRYSSKWCKKVFRDYKITPFLVERFMVYLVEFERNQQIP